MAIHDKYMMIYICTFFLQPELTLPYHKKSNLSDFLREFIQVKIKLNKINVRVSTVLCNLNVQDFQFNPLILPVQN